MAPGPSSAQSTTITIKPSHGERYEHRQQVNGKDNGYRAVSEAELQALKRDG